MIHFAAAPKLFETRVHFCVCVCSPASRSGICSGQCVSVCPSVRPSVHRTIAGFVVDYRKRLPTSPMAAERLTHSRNKTATEVTPSWNFWSTFFPVIASATTKTSCPPSRAGRGSALMTPKFTDRPAANRRTAVQSFVATTLDPCEIRPIGPDIFCPGGGPLGDTKDVSTERVPSSVCVKMSERYSQASWKATTGLSLFSRSMRSKFGPSMTPMVWMVPSLRFGWMLTVCGDFFTVSLVPEGAVVVVVVVAAAAPPSALRMLTLTLSPSGVARITEMTSETCCCPAATDVFCEPAIWTGWPLIPVMTSPRRSNPLDGPSDRGAWVTTTPSSKTARGSPWLLPTGRGPIAAK
mmetsp:Transcript_29993/g.64241  ORF Transcript_29993/g.64241 Transcript_29993/m.64241 type:complete len:351 (+) Transcript_29993:80-1132(+)